MRVLLESGCVGSGLGVGGQDGWVVVVGGGRWLRWERGGGFTCVCVLCMCVCSVMVVVCVFR